MNLSMNEYQDRTHDTAITYHDAIKEFLKNPNPKVLEIFYCSLGLAGEAGEVVDKVKKLLRDGKGIVDEEFLYLISDLG